MKEMFAAGLIVALCAGCASGEKKAKTIHERSWIGGSFEVVPTPKEARAKQFGRFAPLVTRVAPESPLGQAGVREGDLALAIDGKTMRNEKSVGKALENAAANAITVTVYRGGEFQDVVVRPGVERYQDWGFLAFGLSFSPNLSFDLYPNPDFSLVALGFDRESTRVQFADPKTKYLRAIKGNLDEEGWKAWLGPVSLAKRKRILSQELPK